MSTLNMLNSIAKILSQTLKEQKQTKQRDNNNKKNNKEQKKRDKKTYIVITGSTAADFFGHIRDGVLIENTRAFTTIS